MRNRRKGLLLAAGALFAVMMTAPAGAGFAQDAYGGGNANQLISRLNQLETQVQTLSRSVYRGEGGVAPAAPAPVGVDYERVSALEQQLRTQTGEIERLSHLVNETQTRLDRLQADYDARLQQIEGGGAVSSPQPATDAPPQPGYDLQTPPSTGGTLGTISSGGDTPDALYEAAFADVRNAQYEAAEAKFTRFISLYPHNALSGNAQYWLGETYYVRGDYKQAAKTFAQGYQDYPQGTKAPDSLLKLGLSLARMDKKDDACLSLQQLKKQYPGDTVPASRRATQEMKNLGCR